MNLLLTVNAIEKHFGRLQAVNALTFAVDAGEIVSLIGPNGSGKSTALNLISGLYAPDGGTITFAGQRINGVKPHRINRMGIARTFQNLRLFTNMSVMDNVLSAAFEQSVRGLWPTLAHTAHYRENEQHLRERAEDILSFFGSRLMGYRHEQPAYSLSYANRRRLEIARALMTHPSLLLLDEPAAGMNPHESAEIADLIVRIRDHFGCAILLVEHDMHVVARASDHVIALNAGQQIASGDFDTVTASPQVIESYLGTPHLERSAAE